MIFNREGWNQQLIGRYRLYIVCSRYIHHLPQKNSSKNSSKYQCSIPDDIFLGVLRRVRTKLERSHFHRECEYFPHIANKIRVLNGWKDLRFQNFKILSF
jgi:hypothetical protein